MTRKVVTVSPSDKLTTVKNILFDQRFHHIPVVKNEKLVGIITSCDMMKLNLKIEDYENIAVEEVMTKKIVTLEANEKIGAAAQIFLRHLFHGLPIVNGEGDLQGIVTTHDIMRYVFDKEYPNDELERIYRAENGSN